MYQFNIHVKTNARRAMFEFVSIYKSQRSGSSHQYPIIQLHTYIFMRLYVRRTDRRALDEPMCDNAQTVVKKTAIIPFRPGIDGVLARFFPTMRANKLLRPL